MGADLEAGERFCTDSQSVQLCDDDGDVICEAGLLSDSIVLGGQFRIGFDQDGERELFAIVTSSHGDVEQGRGYGPDGDGDDHVPAHTE